MAGAAFEHGDHGDADEGDDGTDGEVEAAADHHPADAYGDDAVDGGLAEYVDQVAGCEEAGVEDPHEDDQGDCEDDLGLPQQEAAEGIELAVAAQSARHEGLRKGGEAHRRSAAIG